MRPGAPASDAAERADESSTATRMSGATGYGSRLVTADCSARRRVRPLITADAARLFLGAGEKVVKNPSKVLSASRHFVRSTVAASGEYTQPRSTSSAVSRPARRSGV